MNAKDLMIEVAKAQGQVLEDGYKQATSLEAMDAYRLAGSNGRVCIALEQVRTAVSDLRADDIPDFIKALKAIVGDK